jgi:hypothetical protein
VTPEKVAAIAVGLLMCVVLALLGVVLYFAATGGINDTRRERIGGVDCVVVYNRLTGSVKAASCPVEEQR